MKHLIIGIVFSLLVACSTTAEQSPGAGPGIKTGADVTAPYGYKEMCARDPKLIECGGAK